MLRLNPSRSITLQADKNGSSCPLEAFAPPHLSTHPGPEEGEALLSLPLSHRCRVSTSGRAVRFKTIANQQFNDLQVAFFQCRKGVPTQPPALIISQTLKQELEAETMDKCCLLSLSKLSQTAQGMMLPIVECVLPHQLTKKAILHRHVHRLTDLSNPSIEITFPGDSSLCQVGS